ncbi:hypothetical protein BC833DRAFT_78752 [Globomyces pollinis-pini]|nr:hypothetical protein BC833DRAFT_78752 [Globomyces pollinis-pini]
MTDQSKKQLAFAVCEFLQENIQDGTIAEDNQESIQVAIQCISDAFNFDLESDKSLSIHPQSLQSLFSVFLKTQSNLKKTVPQKKKVPEQKPINKELAEDLKSQGNKLLAAKDFHAAIEKYTEAIDNDGTNAVYFANRAAAYSQAGDHTAAAIDARTALEVFTPIH